MSEKKPVTQLLVEKELIPSMSMARKLVFLRRIMVNGEVAKIEDLVPPESKLEILKGSHE